MSEKKLLKRSEYPFLLLDIVILILISVNLVAWLIDAIILDTGLSIFLKNNFPNFFTKYQNVWHRDLLIYDTLLTIFLIAELGFRWFIAIIRKSYSKWYMYPFVHWYDVIGSIPITPFKIFRLLRLITILYRLHQAGIIDVYRNGFVQSFSRYYNIVLEELTDRIVIKILDGVQEEITEGGPITQRLAIDVIKPQHDVLVPWLAQLISEASAHTYKQHQYTLPVYLREKVALAIHDSPEFKKIKKSLLFAGGLVEDELQKTVGGILVQVVDLVLTDLSKANNIACQDIAEGVFAAITTPDHHIDAAVRQILLDSLDLIKEQVAIQQWRK